MKKFIPVFLFAGIAALTTAFDIMDNNGKAGYTGSPGETYCTNCHSGTALNGGGGSVTISPIIGTYVLGQTYTINVTVSQTGRSLFGFGFEALLTTGNTNAGTLVITNSAETHLLNAGNGRKNVVHQLNGGASADTHTFTFNWTAPLTNVGNIKFFATGNAANGNNTSSGDCIYSTNQVVQAPALGINSNESSFVQVNVFPNPVHNELNLGYFLSTSSSVSATLFSIDGKRTVELFSETQDSGMHSKQLSLDAGVTPGIYLLEMKVDGKSTVQKIVVM